jgi:hypothetical protein
VRTQLYGERPKLLECGEPDRTELPLSDHVCSLDPSQCCVGRVQSLVECPNRVAKLIVSAWFASGLLA